VAEAAAAEGGVELPLTLLVLAVAGFGPVAAPGPLYSNCGKLVTRPAAIIVTCADANYQLRSLRWRSWGPATAVATGTAEINDCTPTCVAGHGHAYAVSVTLSRPTRCGRSLRFLRLAVTFAGARPKGLRKTDIVAGSCRF